MKHRREDEARQKGRRNVARKKARESRYHSNLAKQKDRKRKWRKARKVAKQLGAEHPLVLALIPIEGESE